MDKEYLHGLMVVGMKENTLTIKSTDLEYTHGPIIGSMLDSGKMVNSTVKVFTKMFHKLSAQVFGRMASVLLGLMMKTSKSKWRKLIEQKKMMKSKRT